MGGKIPLSLGIVGCGDVVRLYFPMLKDMAQKKELSIACVCDIEKEKALLAQRWIEAPRMYTDVEDLLKDDGVDMVLNLTPIQIHYDIIMKAIQAGKHVYTEKPLAADIGQADTIIRSAEKKGVYVGCAPPMALHSDHQRVKQIVESGALGKVCFSRTTGSNPGPAWITEFTTDPTWFYKKGGGPIYDLGMYPIQLMTQLLGPARRVVAFAATSVPERVVVAGEAKGKKITLEVPDNIQIMLEFGEGTFATIDVTYCALSNKDKPRLELFGENGILYLYQRAESPIEIFRREDRFGLRGWMRPEDSFWGACLPAISMSGPPTRPFSWAEGVLHLVQCVENGTKPVLSAEFARHALEIAVKAMESARTGSAITLETGF
jgi:predicted dehydrogenase